MTYDSTDSSIITNCEYFQNTLLLLLLYPKVLGLASKCLRRTKQIVMCGRLCGCSPPSLRLGSISQLQKYHARIIKPSVSQATIVPDHKQERRCLWRLVNCNNICLLLLSFTCRRALSTGRCHLLSAVLLCYICAMVGRAVLGNHAGDPILIAPHSRRPSD